MESPTRPGCRSILRCVWDLIKASVIVHCAGCPSFELARRVFFGALRCLSIGGEEIGDLELLWTAESLPPPAEDRPEMMMTKPGRQHEEVVR
jgi:hypothetical protein